MSAAATVAALLVDVRPVDHPTARDRGIGRYTAGLLGGLDRIGAPVVGLYGSEVEAERARQVAPGAELRPWGPDAVRDHARPATWYLATQLMLHPVSLDPIPAAVTAAGLPVAAVMYDVIPYRNPERYLRDPNARALARVRAPLARTVDALLAISQFSLDTAAAALRYPPARMRVIGAGVDERFAPAAARDVPWPQRIMAGDDRQHVVAVTGGDERKNTEGLLRAWSMLDPEIGRSTRLVIATAVSAAVLQRWRAIASEVGVLDDVVFTGRVTDDEMVALLQRARLAVLPSFDEGFGLPVLEAAACGCPAICAGTSSLPEVLDEPAAWFDPGDPASIARAVDRGVGDEDHRAVLAAAARRSVERFTWERAAADTIAALADLGPRWPSAVRPPERRLALAGPAGETDRVGGDLAAALRRSPSAPRIDELVDRSDVAEPTGAGPGRNPVGALGRYVKRWDFDDIVAFVGAAPGTARATRELAATAPCHLWLGDHELPQPLLDRARSVIVADEETARGVRRRGQDGPPIAVIPPADDAGRPEPDAAWSIDDLAAAVLSWLGAVDHLPPGTIRRFPAR